MSKNTKSTKKYLPWLIIGFVVGLIIRLALLPYGNHNDLITNTGWSEWIYLHGPKGFYENKVWVYDWPTQLPLVNLIYGFNYIIFGKSLALIAFIREFLTNNHILPYFTKVWIDFENWFGWTYYSTTPYMTGHVLSMKVIPVMTDIIIATFIFLIGSKFASRKRALFTALLYLFIPYTFYISSLWGQYDQLSAASLLFSFYLVYLGGKREDRFRNLFIILSVIFYFIAVEVKPTAFFTAPFYIYYIFKQKVKFWYIILTGFVGASLFYITTVPFAGANVFGYTLHTILPRVMFAGRNVLSTQSFNFWELVSPVKQSSVTYLILGIPAIYWGYLFLLVLNLLAILKVSKENNIRTMFLGLFITAGGGYIFSTGMLDRYYFMGLLVFLILTMFYKKTLFLWLVASIIFSINLFTSWGYPVNLQLHDIFGVNYPIVRILSFTQLAIFVLVIVIGFRYKDERNKEKF